MKRTSVQPSVRGHDRLVRAAAFRISFHIITQPHSRLKFLASATAPLSFLDPCCVLASPASVAAASADLATLPPF